LKGTCWEQRKNEKKPNMVVTGSIRANSRVQQGLPEVDFMLQMEASVGVGI
jgi:hypothetical protein